MRTIISFRVAVFLLAFLASAYNADAAGVSGVSVKGGIHRLIDTVVDVIVSNKNPDSLQAENNKKDSSDGAGFIIDENGLIVTNCHVIETADIIKIVLYDGSVYIAKVIGKDEHSDIALLKIDADIKLPYVKFADSELVEIGEPVLAIGNPYGFGKTVTSGIISYKNRNLSSQIAELGTGGDLVSYLQTDAAVNYGNSGGPLFTYAGEVVGMITVFLADGMRSTGINFAIPANILKRTIEQLKNYGKITRSWIGIVLNPLTKEAADILLGGRFGCDIVKIEKKSPAENAGIRVNDILISINDENITENTNLEYMLNTLPIGRVIPIQIIRDGIEMKFSITVGFKNEEDLSANSDEEVQSKKEIPFERVEGINVGVTDLTPEFRKYFDIPEGIGGVLISNVENVLSEMSVGNLIFRVNRTMVSSVAQLKNALKEVITSKEKRVVLYIYDHNRKQKRFYVVLKLAYKNEPEAEKKPSSSFNKKLKFFSPRQAESVIPTS